MDRHGEAIRAAAKRHSPFWREIIELADKCCLAVRVTGSYQALDQRYLLNSGILITGRNAMKWVLAVGQALKDVPNIDAKEVWDDLDKIGEGGLPRNHSH